MKLSDAIRLGVERHPQGFGSFFSCTDQGELATCALGAALDVALGGVPDTVEGANYQWVQAKGYPEDYFPELSAFTQHPQMPEIWKIQEIIIDLNDVDKRSREAIADWLDTLPHGG